MAWGGARSGAGRKSDGKQRKDVRWRLSEDEKEYLRKCLEEYRKRSGNNEISRTV